MLSFISSVLASCDPNDPIGCIHPPAFIPPISINPATGEVPELVNFLNIILKLIFVVAGLFAFLNLILAGFAFISAGGDPKNVTKAWDKIWQTFVGLLIIVSSFLIAAIIGILFFGDATALIAPKIIR